MQSERRPHTWCIPAAAVVWLCLTVACATTRPVQLAWEDQNPNKTVYRIERKEGPNGTYRPIATLPPGVTAYTDTEAKAGVMYYYRIQAVTPDGQVLYSNELGAKPAAP